MRLLDHENAPRKKYYSRKKRGELITVNHWGQRKLLMSEIEFITRCIDPGVEATIVYAGAAPGSHTNFLADMFPSCRFVLVDPAPFVATETEKVRIINDYMTEKIAAEYKDAPNVFFVSDIRTANPRVMSRDQVEERVKIDNQLQIDWIEIMNPQASLLKFRCPYYFPDSKSKGSQAIARGSTNTAYEYYKGDVYLPVWGPQSTTECRLYVPRKREMMKYDIQAYEEQLFYFNTETRVSYYPHNVKSRGLCHCFDCRSEVRILGEYLRKFKETSPADLDTRIARMIPVISKAVGTSRSGRTLEYIEPTRSSVVPKADRRYERQYSMRLVRHAPDQVQASRGGKKRMRDRHAESSSSGPPRKFGKRVDEFGRDIPPRRVFIKKRPGNDR